MPVYKSNEPTKDGRKWFFKCQYKDAYGEKGIGVINDPEKAIYNKVYNKVTVDTIKPIRKKADKKIKDTFDFRIK